MSSRSYRSGTVAALMSLSRGACYWPTCTHPIVQFVNSEPVLQVQIAHIFGLKPGSARFNTELPEASRNHFVNLILLCDAHHKTIDNHENEYPVELLLRWKGEAEQGDQQTLAAVGELTEDDLQSLISEQLAVQLDRLDTAVDRLESLDREAAALLRPLLKELRASRFNRPLVSEGTAEMLSMSADQLRHLEGSAEMLFDAAEQLKKLPTWTNNLISAAEMIR
ncbi:hypothetical protein [Kribbella deserti]|uniref:HNH endonuclease n=1 Tax=Kribbella deserti TaxID=1926257 RepID=A0ABV6QDW8_9ACTN